MQAKIKKKNMLVRQVLIDLPSRQVVACHQLQDAKGFSRSGIFFLLINIFVNFWKEMFID